MRLYKNIMKWTTIQFSCLRHQETTTTSFSGDPQCFSLSERLDEKNTNCISLQEMLNDNKNNFPWPICNALFLIEINN